MNFEHADLLILGGTVITCLERGVISQGALAIRGNEIVDIGKRKKLEKRYRGEEIDASGKVIMPGLIDGHTHNVQILLRGRFDNKIVALPPVWMNFLIPFEEYLSDRQVEIASLLSSLNMIKSGTTCFVEAGGPKPGVIAEASLKSGIRGMITRSAIDMDPNMPMYEETDGIVNDYENLVKKWHQKADGRLKVWISIRELMLNSMELHEKLFDLANKYDTRVTMHLAEDRTEVDFCLEEYGKRPVELVYEKGFLNEKVLAAHMIF